MNKETIKKSNKKEGEELQEYLQTMRRHGIVPAKKGKGAKYNRAKEKQASAMQREPDFFNLTFQKIFVIIYIEN